MVAAGDMIILAGAALQPDESNQIFF